MSFVGDNMMDQILHFETNFPRLENNRLKRGREGERERGREGGREGERERERGSEREGGREGDCLKYQ